MALDAIIPDVHITAPSSPSGSSLSNATMSTNDGNLPIDRPSQSVKNFKVRKEDSTSKILPVALRKYKLGSCDWEQYVMFICYGGTERALSLDEKPLALFQKLKDAKKSPIFMLKHVKDIRSPPCIAAQKLALAKLLESKAESSSPPSKTTAKHQSHGDDGASATSLSQVASTDVSYAVAIYPYVAKQDDEYDVNVNDEFIVFSRTKGWCAVQRDMASIEIIDPDVNVRGWIPAGCLLETNVPVSNAIEATRIAQALSSPSTPSESTPPAPILPVNFTTKSFVGIALKDYRSKGDEELDVAKDDLLRVYKLYAHWNYAVNEAGKRGWVPSWYIGKVKDTHSDEVSPPTPSTELVTPWLFCRL